MWTLLEKQTLIDRILNAYPIPLIPLADKSTQSGLPLAILDGLQRLHTIVSFIENGFSTEDGRYFDVDKFTRAKEERESGQFQDKRDAPKVTRSEVAKILDYVLPISIIRNASDPVVTDVFGRINSFGHRLSDQERRQAGLVSPFVQFVRDIACEIRGDVSVEIIPLYQMPEISVDLPKAKSGYTVQAEDVFWVRQGILRSTDLRDSLDEQVIADVICCLVSDELIERSKDTLDSVYDQTQPESKAIDARFATYGSDRLKEEIKYTIDVIETIVRAGDQNPTLRSLIFQTRTTNPFPTAFSTIFIAIHELSFRENLILANARAAQGALIGVYGRMNTRRDALVPEERRNNANLVKGLIRDSFVRGDVAQIAFGRRRELDIENTLRRSQIEMSRFEIKQGVVRLDDDRNVDRNVFVKVCESICAIANIGRDTSGLVMVGVADTRRDAERIAEIDGIVPIEVGNRWVVGVDREEIYLTLSAERYYQMWRDEIENAGLSQPLKSDVLAGLDLCELKGLHILLISIPSQRSVSFLNGKVFTRDGDQTVEASPEKIVGISARFGK